MTGHLEGKGNGLRSIVAYNWPALVVAIIVIGSGTVVLRSSSAGHVAQLSALVVTGPAAFFFLASLASSWWIYDASGLYRWDWLRPLLPTQVERWVLLHAGLDESRSAPLPFATAADAVVDVSPMIPRPSGSLRRARRRDPADATVVAGSLGVPLASQSVDAAVVLFAAHEVRDRRQREALFSELQRVLKPTGRLLLVEHCRDWANAAVFGPGAWHFQRRREWIRLARHAGFARVQEVSHTPFVRGFALCSS